VIAGLRSSTGRRHRRGRGYIQSQGQSAPAGRETSVRAADRALVD
jgi:hypothetical protein